MDNKLDEIRKALKRFNQADDEEELSRARFVIELESIEWLSYLLAELDAAKRERNESLAIMAIAEVDLKRELDTANTKLKDYEGCKGIEEYYTVLQQCRDLRSELDEANETIQHLMSPDVESLKYEKGAIDMRLSNVHAMNIMESFVDLFEQNGGKNFLTMTMEAPARDKRYEITIKNLNGELSAAEKMNAIQSELDTVKQENERLRKALDHVGFYCAGTEFDHVSKWILKNVHGEGESRE